MKTLSLTLLCILLTGFVYSQDNGEDTSENPPGQSRESAAVDPTATQWSYQFAYEQFFDYKETFSDGSPRPQGNQRFGQFRMVAPIPKGKIPFTLLPRLTFRYQQNAAGDWGIGGSDIFVLGIAKDWGTGRAGIGPQYNFPSQKGFGSTVGGFGFATAVTQRALKDKLFFALLFQQTWTNGQASPLVINPTFVLQLGKGFYLGNGDFVMQYNWQSKSWFVPVGLRFGKAFINDKRTINAYVEWAASAVYDEWPGSAAGQSIRINVQWQIPVKL